MRLPSEKQACPRRGSPARGQDEVKPLLNRVRSQSFLGRQTSGSSLSQPLEDAYCERADPPTRGASALAAHGRGSPPRWVAKRREATGSSPCVGIARAAGRRAGGLCGSNRAKAAGQNPPGADATEIGRASCRERV